MTADADDPFFKDREIVGADVKVDVPVERAFEYLADLTREPAWMTDVEEVRKTSRGPVRKGSRYWEVPRAGAGQVERELTVEEIVPNRLIRVRAGSVPFGTREEFSVEPTPDGKGTTIRIRIGVPVGSADEERRTRLAWDAEKLAERIASER